MSIRMMTDEAAAIARPGVMNPDCEIVWDFSGHGFAEVRHGFDCPHYHEQGSGIDEACVGHRCDYRGPLFMRTTHQGMVLATGEHNFHDDSDFYAIVWDDAKGEAKEVEYASTRGWSYPNGATVDADEATKAKYQAWTEARAEVARKEAARREAAEVAIGKTVQVVKGRKVAVGTVGKVFWMGPTQSYSPSRWAAKSRKIGLALSDKKDERGRHTDVAWTYEQNVAVVGA